MKKPLARSVRLPAAWLALAFHCLTFSSPAPSFALNLDSASRQTLLLNSTALSGLEPVTEGPPYFVQDLTNVTVEVHEIYVLAPQLEGSAPLYYKWSYFDAFDGEVGVVNTDGENLHSLRLSGHWRYRDFWVVVTNSFGSVTSQVAHINVTGPPVVYSISPGTVTLAEGDAVDLAAVVGGNPPLTYQWRLDNIDIPGATNLTLSIEHLSVADAGTYTMRASTPEGSGTSKVVRAELKIWPADMPPLVTSNPEWLTLWPGTSLQLGGTALSTTPMTYWWLFNGSPIAGADQTNLDIGSMEAAYEGTYVFCVSNMNGSAMSMPAVLSMARKNGGTVLFSSIVGTNRLYVYDTDRVTPLFGSYYLVQLYAGPTPESLGPVGAAVPIINPGRFYSGIRRIESVAPGSTAFVQVRAWDSRFGPTYEQALAAGGQCGTSMLATTKTGGLNAIDLPLGLDGLQGFSLDPGAGGPGQSAGGFHHASLAPPRYISGIVRLTVKGDPGLHYAVELSQDLRAWTYLTEVMLTGPTATVFDQTPLHHPLRFYRLRESGRGLPPKGLASP